MNKSNSLLINKQLYQDGQGMTEYIIIVALIAVAAIGASSYFGSTVRNQVAAMAGEVAGNKSISTASKAAADADATKAASAAATQKGLANYNAGNNAQAQGN